MEIVHTTRAYLNSEGKPEFKENFDFLLFRQDFNGTESVYFNRDEIDDIITQVSDNEILIHRNYSILFCRHAGLLGIAPELGCYTTTFVEGD